jgi:hypothetical protein
MPPWSRREIRPPAGRPTSAPTEDPCGDTSTRPLRRTDSSWTPASPTLRPADDPETEGLVRHPLTEVEPGLFLADNGETLDLRGPAQIWRNLRLVRVSGPAPWQWAILGAAAILAAAWLVAAGVRTVRRQRSRPAPTTEPTTARRWRRIAGSIATLSALLALGTVVLVAAMPGLVDSSFLGWLELPIALRVALHLPLALSPGTTAVDRDRDLRL